MVHLIKKEKKNYTIFKGWHTLNQEETKIKLKAMEKKMIELIMWTFCLWNFFDFMKNMVFKKPNTIQLHTYYLKVLTTINDFNS